VRWRTPGGMRGWRRAEFLSRSNRGSPARPSTVTSRRWRAVGPERQRPEGGHPPVETALPPVGEGGSGRHFGGSRPGRGRDARFVCGLGKLTNSGNQTTPSRQDTGMSESSDSMKSAPVRRVLPAAATAACARAACWPRRWPPPRPARNRRRRGRCRHRRNSRLISRNWKFLNASVGVVWVWFIRRGKNP